MVLLRNRNQDLTEIENRRILFLCDVFRKTDLGIDMIANAFRGSGYKIIFKLFVIYFQFNHLSFRKKEGSLFLLTIKRQFNYSLSLLKDAFTYGHSILHKMLLVRLHVYRLKPIN